MALFYHTVLKTNPKKEVKEDQGDKKTNQIKEEEMKIRFSRPVAELFNNVKTIFNPYSGEIRERKIQNKKEIKKYLDFANILENRILGGDISIKKYENDKVQ